jgi:hypothetical protein
MKELTELHIIRYQFSKDETAKHSSELAEACAEKQAIEAEKKSMASTLKAKIDAQDSRIGLLSRYINTGYDHRNVECIVKKNFAAGTKEYYFQGELVDTQPLTQEDHQLGINDHAAKFRDDMDKAGFEVGGFDKDTNTLTMNSKK